MYSIYADNKCIYNDVSPSQTDYVVNPTLVIEDNAAGSLEFTIPKSNTNYDYIKRITSNVVVKRDGIEIWAGRVLDEDTDFYNNRKLYCEGELAYFNDSNQPPAEYHDLTVRQFLETLVSIHNSQVDENHRFTVGAVTVEDPNDSVYHYTNYESTMVCLSDKLLGTLGGHLVIRKENGVRYLDYLKDYIRTSTQQIYFGKNLLDFAKNYSMADFVTAIIPLGESLNTNDYSADNTYEVGEYCNYNGYIWRCITTITEPEEWTPAHWKKIQKYFEALRPYLTVEEVNNGNVIVAKKSLTDQYGVIIGVKTWDDVTDASILLSKAQEYLNTVNYDNLEIEVTAVDLRFMGVNYDAIALLDRVRVISRPHNLNQLFPVRKIELPLDQPQNTKFTLSSKEHLNESISGATTKNLQDLQNDFYSISNEMSSTGKKISKALEAAKQNATVLINQATNGYVTLLHNENGTSELLITDEQDYTRAHKIWRWNINGLGYSNDGGQTYGLAMTMNGAIVADYVTAGTMLADRVKGGTFEVGGSDIAADGSIIIKDSQGRKLIEINKNGMTLYDQNGQGKAWLQHSGLVLTGGTVNASSINAAQIDGCNIGSACTISTPKFSVDANGAIYNWGTYYCDSEINGARCVGRLGVISYGDLYVQGSKNRMVQTKTFGPVTQNSYETATPYFGDIGEGELDDSGICYIAIDDVFYETVNTKVNYQVFLQKYGEGDIWVSERTPDYFIVKGTPGLKFGFEYKVVQRDYEDMRNIKPVIPEQEAKPIPYEEKEDDVVG